MAAAGAKLTSATPKTPDVTSIARMRVRYRYTLMDVGGGGVAGQLGLITSLAAECTPSVASKRVLEGGDTQPKNTPHLLFG